jgi:hypothetical protein
VFYDSCFQTFVQVTILHVTMFSDFNNNGFMCVDFLNFVMVVLLKWIFLTN